MVRYHFDAYIRKSPFGCIPDTVESLDVCCCVKTPTMRSH